MKERVTGLGIVATKYIAANTLLCDYHGELCTYDVGHRRYTTEYANRDDNNYMFMFEFEGGRHYMDAVNGCSCCPKERRLKGRLMNHSSKGANVMLKPRRLGGDIRLLMFSSRDINTNEACLINYNCGSDKQSDFQDWMKQ